MAWRPEWEDSGSSGGGFGPRGSFTWSATKILLTAMAGLFVLNLIVTRMGSKVVYDLLALDSNNWFLLYPMFSYVFAHDTFDLLHLLFNSLIIYFMGTFVEGVLGRRRFLTLFFGAAFVGALAFMATLPFPLSVDPDPLKRWRLIGASGAALGLLFYAAWHSPNQRVIFIVFPLRLRTLAYIVLALDLYPLLQGVQDGVAHFCHLGGALVGYLYWKFEPDPFAWTARAREHVAEHSQQRRERKALDADREMDRILAKINEKGMPSLTAAERRFLQDRSRDLRGGRGR